jgi:hypothetical protein
LDVSANTPVVDLYNATVKVRAAGAARTLATPTGVMVAVVIGRSVAI